MESHPTHPVGETLGVRGQWSGWEWKLGPGTPVAEYHYRFSRRKRGTLGDGGETTPTPVLPPGVTRDRSPISSVFC